MTYHVCDNHLRRKYPQRASLKNKLTYLLTQRTGQTGLAVWDGADGARLAASHSGETGAARSRATSATPSS